MQVSNGVLVGRMIFIGGLVLALLGLGFGVMLGIAAGSIVALIIFGVITIAGGVISFLATRDLTGPSLEREARVVAKNKNTHGGNPNYELGFQFSGSALHNTKPEFVYNVTNQDWERFALDDTVLLRYSTYFKLLIDIRKTK